MKVMLLEENQAIARLELYKTITNTESGFTAIRQSNCETAFMAREHSFC
jgi:hypothetical protein